MNLWKHDDQARYDDVIYGGSNRLLVRFDEAPEASLRRIEKNALQPLLTALTKAYKKDSVKRIDVVVTCYSTQTMFDTSSFWPINSAMRVFLERNFAPVNDWNVHFKEQQHAYGIKFEIKLYGENL